MDESIIAGLIEKGIVGFAFVYLLRYFLGKFSTTLDDISKTLKEVSDSLVNTNKRLDSIEKRMDNAEKGMKLNG